ncbi:MAG: response regulator transcription factor [Proteobacteria bacterium]|nr:MAG: response regulator transcription factor [Pseudomonadota bacterium]
MPRQYQTQRHPGGLRRHVPSSLTIERSSRHSFRTRLEGRSAISVAGIERTSPDIAIVDLSLKSSNGLELIKDLKARGSSTPVLVLSMHDEALYAERVLRAGAFGGEEDTAVLDEKEVASGHADRDDRASG